MKRGPRLSGKGIKHLSWFLSRYQDMSSAHDQLMLSMRLYRQALASADANEQTWVELAGLLNVCGMAAQARERDDWLLILSIAADAMRNIEDRHRRVGGRYVGTDTELRRLTEALNLIDSDMLPSMTMVEFAVYADRVNEMVGKHDVQQEPT